MAMKKALLEKNVVIRETYKGYTPIHNIPLSESETELATDLIKRLREIEEVGRFYHNIEQLTQE